MRGIFRSTRSWSAGRTGLGLLSALVLAGVISAQQPKETVAPSASDDPVVLPETVVRGVRPAFEPNRGAGSIFGGLDGAGNAPGSAALLDLGGGYQSGTSNMRAITWGYIAGNHAASRA